MIRLHLSDVELEFRTPLHTADGTYPSRRSVVVGYESDGVIGWGEAAAFPSGRWGTIDEAWDSLAKGDPDGAAGQPLAAAAVQAARRDHDARTRGLPLCQALGGAVRPVPARVSLGLSEDTDNAVAAVGAAVRAGATRIKMKIQPGRDLVPVAAVRAAFPDLAISVDANGAYVDSDDSVFSGLDRLGVDLIEQPLPPGDLAGCARLRERMVALVCVDEDLRSVADADRVLSVGAADVLSLKLMRLGYDTALSILRRCRDAGVAVKAGGTFDTAIGRHHVLAFATLDGVSDAEAGPPEEYLKDPLADYPRFVGGTITPWDAPGIGVVPDQGRIATHLVRAFIVERH